MDFLIFYFSGTGNTWWVAKHLTDELIARGKTVEMYSLENPQLADKDFLAGKLSEAKHIILGHPIYGSGMPDIMADFTKNLPVAKKGQMISVYCTQGGFSGDGSLYQRGALELKGYTFLQSRQFCISSNFHVKSFPFNYIKPANGEALKKAIDKNVNKVFIFAEDLVNEREVFEGTFIFNVMFGYYMRWDFIREKKKLTKYFNFHKEKCIKCKICVRTCPTKNIVMEDPDNDLIRKDNCILCMRCYNHCPKGAISFGKNIHNPDQYIRYKGPVEKMRTADIRK